MDPETEEETMVTRNYNSELKAQHRIKREVIEKRLREFKITGEGSDERIFVELCFCICTPQSRAKMCDKAINNLVESGALFHGGVEDVRKHLHGVRFPNNKARYIVEAREFFTRNGRLAIKEELNRYSDPIVLRDYLVENVKGLGLKEASHFLRNIGMGDDLAILDRHILNNIVTAGIIDEIPETLSRRRYWDIEEGMRRFSRRVGIPFTELDLLLWWRETGEVFK